MSDSILRVGIIGVGVIAMGAHAPALRSTRRAQITAICRRGERQLAMARQHPGVDEAYTDWREMLDKAQMDAVVICTPHDLRREPAVAALQRGLHVLLEKPMALTFRDAWAIVEAARAADRVLMIAYNARFNGKNRTAKKALTDGRIGRVRQAIKPVVWSARFWWTEPIPQGIRAMVKQASGMADEFYHNWEPTADYWRKNPEQTGGGVLADPGTHSVSSALWLCGAPPVEVVAFSESVGLPVESFISIQARLANGVLLSLPMADLASSALPQRPPTTWTVIGDDGVLTTDHEGDFWIESAQAREKLEPDVPDIPPAIAFLESVLDGKPNLSPSEDGAYAAALSEAAYQSAAEGRIVRLSLP